MGTSYSSLRPWESNTEASVALVALDICGFSKDPELEQLLHQRTNLFQAVQEAPRAQELIGGRIVKLQFVGDELRFAFRADIPECARKVQDFVKGIFSKLAEVEPRTTLKGVVLHSDLRWNEFMGCEFFDGPAAVSCSDWLGCAHEGEIVINSGFRDALEAEGVPTASLEKRECNGDDGFLLR